MFGDEQPVPELVLKWSFLRTVAEWANLSPLNRVSPDNRVL
jgi:hypothetical protein